MATLAVYYAQGHGDAPVTISTPDEVDALIDRVRRESPGHAPMLLEAHIAGDPYAQGLDVGVRGDRGVLRYSGRDWPEGVYSTGDGPSEGEPLVYYFMDNYTEFPPNAEVPLAVVRQAIRDFLATGGERSARVEWQPGE
ncbi:Imm1 family immunity protein [Amycolatopsis pigmentata]|uniref:Imm1 family immunity protein n=1 Tax=Amycolatopsis pigmentata TaxID=450801 RepID=A0ABW5FY50_9PSEU